MSRKILLSSLSDEERKKISTDLTIKCESNKHSYGPPLIIYPFDIEDDLLYVPFAYDLSFPRKKREQLPSINVKFKGDLRDHQHKVKSESLEHLNKNGCSLIAAYPGFGKSCSSLYIASRIKLKTLIVIHRIVLANQWKTSIEKFFENATCQIINGKNEKKDCDFYIINAINVPKRDRDFYNDIGFVIVDECHVIMAEKLSKCMVYITPRYILGLSATPYRMDGTNILFDLYFGKEKITRELKRHHTVYTVETNFRPIIEYTITGKLNWGVVLDSQANNLERNELIIKIVKFFKKRTFLIMTKRVEQAKFLEKRLLEEGEHVQCLTGSDQEFDKSCRVLVGTGQKVGIGFDFDKLDSLILGADIESYFVQYLGRIIRTEDVQPIVFDLIDDYPILYKHFLTRKTAYLESGGRLKRFEKEFPEFYNNN